MKDTLLTLAKYNAHANNAVLELVEPLKPKEICAHCGSYYESILGLLQHILVSEIKIIRKIQDEFPEKTFDYGDYSNPAIPMDTLIPPEFHATADALRRMDANLIAMITTFNDEELQKEVQGLTCPVRGKFILLHLLNHGTHHRGNISQILDEMGVEHDFSGILQNYPHLETV